MNLRFTLPDDEKELASAVFQGEPIVYCVPFDLHLDGSFCQNGWIVVTKSRLLVLTDGEITSNVDLAQMDEIICVAQVDNGVLASRKDSTDTLLCRFSMQFMVRESYVARGASGFCRGDDREVVSKEREKKCFRCGRVLPGTSICPHCDGRGRSFRRFFDLCKPYILPLLCVTVMMAAISAITIGQQYIQRDFVDNVLVPAKGTAGDVLTFLGTMSAAVITALLLTVGRTFWTNSLGTRISRDLRARVFEKINSLSLSFMDSRRPGELMNRVVEDSGKIRQFMEDVFAGMFTQLFTMIGACVVMLTIDWKIALLTVCLLPAACVLVRMFHTKEKRLWRQQWRFNDQVNNRLQDVLSGIRVVKSFGQEERESKRFQEYTERLMTIQRRNEIFWATLYPFVTLLLTMGSFFVIYFGGTDVLGGRMSPGELVQFVAYAGMLFGPLGFMTRMPRMVMQLVTSLERIYDILDEQPDVGERADAIDQSLAGMVEFQDVTFGYKSYLPVLEHVTLSVEPGEMIGLVGPSGAGKSTMINLIMRLYNVDDGRLLLDGQDIRDYSIESLHRQIGVVLQETFLFSGTIYDNIRYAKPEADTEEIIRAAKMANAHDFITRFPDGYDTYVGESGHTLSGGERQRIAIARAILHNPRLLILDEATSSLDTETEYQIQEALGRLTQGRTTFAIAHRLSTLRNADRIVVIDHHTIAEIGSHYELMKKKGIYYGLVMAQLEMHKIEPKINAPVQKA